MRIAILGAAGRDFHNFNVVYREDPAYEVVAFTAAQIPGIAERRYPEALAGADFTLLGPKRTMLKAGVPVIAVSAVRTGCGESQTTRYLARRLRDRRLRVAVIRHPMPYGDLAAQRVQRFARRTDLDAAHCTIEEREEYEPHLAAGGIVYAGVDYAAVAAQAERETDVILWDGGNNDFPFFQPDLHIVLIDALCPGHEATHHPGETVLRMADVIVVAKADAAAPPDAANAAENARALNPRAMIVRGASPVVLNRPAAVHGKRVIAVDDGPTLTHGGMPYGAAYVAAEQALAARIIDPRPWATPEIAAVYAQYPHVGAVLPAMGYSDAQLGALQATLNAADADVIVAGTPIDLAALIELNKPVVRARYEFAELEAPGLWGAVERMLATLPEGIP